MINTATTLLGLIGVYGWGAYAALLLVSLIWTYSNGGAL